MLMFIANYLFSRCRWYTKHK